MNIGWLRAVFSGILTLALIVVVNAWVPVASAKKVVEKDKSVAADTKLSGLPSPSKEVEAITKNLLKTFHDNKARYQKDHNAYVEEVDRLLSPVVAFDSIARGVMGKYAHRSEPAQIKQFEKVFKDSLINFYGKALLKLDDTHVSIEQVEDVSDQILNDYKQGKVRQVPVNMSVKTSDRTLVISYSMVFEENHWKLRNIIIDGINIGIQFRRQFAEAMEQHRKIQYVIDHWLEIMTANNKEKDDKGKNDKSKK